MKHQGNGEVRESFVWVEEMKIINLLWKDSSRGRSSAYSEPKRTGSGAPRSSELGQRQVNYGMGKGRNGKTGTGCDDRCPSPLSCSSSLILPQPHGYLELSQTPRPPLFSSFCVLPRPELQASSTSPSSHMGLVN